MNTENEKIESQSESQDFKEAKPLDEASVKQPETNLPKKEVAVNLSEQQFEGFVSELQRSFDFCRSQLGKAVPNQLILDPIFADNKTSVEKLTQILETSVEIIDVNKYLVLKDKLDVEYQMDCVALFGAVLGVTDKEEDKKNEK